jgi:hypothetical protein
MSDTTKKNNREDLKLFKLMADYQNASHTKETSKKKKKLNAANS